MGLGSLFLGYRLIIQIKMQVLLSKHTIIIRQLYTQIKAEGVLFDFKRAK